MRRWLTIWLGLLPALCGQPLRIRTLEFPWAIVRAGYSARIETLVGGGCPRGDGHLWVTGGALPQGLEIRGENLMGTPAETGTFYFSLRAENGCSSASQDYELTVTGKPILRVLPESLAFVCHAGQAMPAALPVRVSASWPNLPYSVRGDAGWLTHRLQAGVTPPPASGLSSDLVMVSVDAGNLAPGTYHGSLLFSTWLGANAPVTAVTLTVLPAPGN